MTAELGRTRDPADLVPGDVGRLHTAAVTWRGHARDAARAADGLRALRTVPEWTGEAADAYDGRMSTIAAGWTALAEALGQGAEAIEVFASALAAARARAGDAIDLWDRADALDAAAALPASSADIFTGRPLPLAGTAHRSEATAILADARTALREAGLDAAAALRAAIATPGLGADEWAALLGGRASASQLLDALAGADAGSAAFLLRTRPAYATLLATAEPGPVAQWWTALDPSQRDALVATIPAVIGNLGGVAHAARDQANRLWLRRQLADARAALAAAEEAPSVVEVLGGEAAAKAYAERLEAARTRLRGLEGVEASLVSPEGSATRYLITLTGDSPPLAAVGIGDLDTADTITYAVPGMGTTTEGMGGWARAAQNLADQQHRADPGRSHATIAWVGYQTPPIPVAEGGFDVMHNDLADAGASNLARDLVALDYVNPGAQVAVVAHSYGTTTASLALARDDVHVDAFATLGSAGLSASIDSAADIHAGSVFSGQAQDVWAIDPARGDQWAWTGRLAPDHPIDPMGPDFGSHPFSVAGDATLRAVDDHAAVTAQGGGYLDRQTESLRNVALATTGHGDLVSPYVPPTPTAFQKALIRGMANGFSN